MRRGLGDRTSADVVDGACSVDSLKTELRADLVRQVRLPDRPHQQGRVSGIATQRAAKGGTGEGARRQGGTMRTPGASSSTFWCRRWTEQSRSYR